MEGINEEDPHTSDRTYLVYGEGNLYVNPEGLMSEVLEKIGTNTTKRGLISNSS